MSVTHWLFWLCVVMKWGGREIGLHLYTVLGTGWKKPAWYRICPCGTEYVRVIKDMSARYRICPRYTEYVRVVQSMSALYIICPRYAEYVRAIQNKSVWFRVCARYT